MICNSWAQLFVKVYFPVILLQARMRCNPVCLAMQKYVISLGIQFLSPSRDEYSFLLNIWMDSRPKAVVKELAALSPRNRVATSLRVTAPTLDLFSRYSQTLNLLWCLSWLPPLACIPLAGYTSKLAGPCSPGYGEHVVYQVPLPSVSQHQCEMLTLSCACL